jgi:putative ABC transport system substrate-binding protein
VNRRQAIGILALLVVVAALVGLWLQHKPQTKAIDDRFDVVIFSIVEIEPITQLRQGFKEVFSSSDFAQGREVQIREYNAQGDSGLINQIADKIVAEKPDLVYALGTPVAQAIQKRDPELLVLQGAATDPVEAGLAESWDGSGRNYIATSDLPPISKQMELIRDLTPNVRRLGVIYNPGETNSVAVVSRLRVYINDGKLGWQLVESHISNTSDVSTAMRSLLGRADAVYLPPDNTAHAAIPVIGQIATENKLPFYATVDSALEEGALAALALDFTQLGRESAQLALAVLQGQDPSTMPIKLNESPIVSINRSVARNLGLDLAKFQSRPRVQIR